MFVRQTPNEHRVPTDPPGTRATARLVVLSCAASAGAHAGLVPEHMGEAAALGIGFVVAALLLLAAGAALAIQPDSPRAAQAASLLLVGLIASYAASRTSGIPLLQPEPEAPDAVGLATKLIEALALAGALWLSQPTGGRRSPIQQEVTR